MRKLAFLIIVFVFPLVFSGCSLQEKWKGVKEFFSSAQQQVETTRKNIEKTVKGVKETAENIKEAVQKTKSALDAIGGVFKDKQENQKENVNINIKEN